MRLLKAWADLLAASMEKWAAETREYTRRLPEREYWHGYTDAMHDMKQEGAETDA